ncbi:acyl-CoA dehydrogenase family protein [Streptomyces sp. TRM 70361]|uniref:acyl-CoA dehydrogenase family protein n=1 Tax=Streptomyces sp. TRM 70361 TaxID=3116553 RepID=UPI002E7AFC0A|nr:acyl-CoA dehydrogenase family protein [Streptomyces sp. TRM 70361]MEE1938041.1 acyl-CoA dehydrogenase family protein [Streptomyces sp. TRM 70361]
MSDRSRGTAAGPVDGARASFSPPDSVRDLRDRVRDFVRGEVIPAESELASGGETARETLRTLRDKARANGLWALSHPAELGGRGLSLSEFVHLGEVEGESEYGPAVLGSEHLLDALMLHRHAGPEVRERYLSGLVDGEVVPCYGMSEPGRSGSDPSLLTTRAEPHEGGWTIRGAKWFCRAAGADFITVMCRTEPLGIPNRQAFTMFVVPTDTPGFEIVRELPVLGTDDAHREVRLDGVRVPDAYRIGVRGDGFPVAGERLDLGRTLRAVQWLGQARRAFDLMCRRLTTRTAFGERLAAKQLMQQHVFDSYTEIQAARSQVLRAAAAVDASDRQAYPEVATAKVLASRTLCRVLDRAVQVYGAEGLIDDTPLSRMFRRARATRIYDGPDELHAHTVAKRILRRYAPGSDTPVDVF